MKSGVKIEGEKELIKLLNQMPDKAHRAAVRAGINAGCQEIVKEARREAKTFKKSGALAKSITKKVFTTKDKKIIGIVGADKKVEIDGNKPYHYLHLVEFGHIDRGGNFVQGKRFLSGAQQKTKSLQLNKFETKTRIKMDKETEKLARALGAK